MKKIKSTITNLYIMYDEKKHNKQIIESNTTIIQIENNLRESNFTKVKKIKIIVANSGSVINDLISDNKLVSLEESTIINALISYLSENINKNKKLNELYIYIIQYISRYISLLLIHTIVLHDNSDKYLPTIDYIQHFIK